MRPTTQLMAKLWAKSVDKQFVVFYIIQVCSSKNARSTERVENLLQVIHNSAFGSRSYLKLSYFFPDDFDRCLPRGEKVILL